MEINVEKIFKDPKRDESFDTEHSYFVTELTTEELNNPMYEPPYMPEEFFISAGDWPKPFALYIKKKALHKYWRADLRKLKPQHFPGR